MDNVKQPRGSGIAPTFQSASHRVGRTVFVGASVHVLAFYIASTTHCTSDQGYVPELHCSAGVGSKWAVAFIILSFVGAPLLQAQLLKRAGQRHSSALAWSAQTLVPATTYYLFLPQLSIGAAGAGRRWELLTQLLAVPLYFLMVGVALGGRPWAQKDSYRN